MANQFYHSGQFTTIVFDGTTNWDSLSSGVPAGYFPNGMVVHEMQWYIPSGSDMIVREGSPTSNVYIIYITDLGGGGGAKLFHQTKCHPCVKGTDVDSGAILIIHRA